MLCQQVSLGRLLINRFRKFFIALLWKIEKAIKILIAFFFFFFHKNFPKITTKNTAYSGFFSGRFLETLL